MQAGAQGRVVAFGACMAAVIVGHMIAAKATRDALFLTHFDIRLLPRMVVISAVFSGVVTLATTRLRVRADPRHVTAVLAAISAGLLATLYFVAARAPQTAAALFYLHTMSLGPLMATGFWSVINEALDPRRAKGAVGKISAGGTLGAVMGGLVAERVASAAQLETVLLFLVGTNLVCLIGMPLFPKSARPDSDSADQSGAVDVLLRDPYLRTMAGLVALTVAGAGLLDFALKAEAVAAFGRGEPLLRFFAWYYVATSALSFVVQVGLGKTFLTKLGVVRTVASLPLSMAAAAGIGLMIGGIIAATAARALEGIVRSSLYRSGYELLYTPIARPKKRAAKPLLEIVVDRAAEAVAGGLISVFVWALPADAVTLCFAGVLACGAVGYLLVRRLKTGYVGALAGQLESIPEIPAAAALLHDGTLTIDGRGGLTAYFDAVSDRSPAPLAPNPRIATLLSGLLSSDIEIVRRTLAEARPLDPRLIAAVIPLLDDKDVKAEAAEALRDVGKAHVGQLADVLANPDASPFRLRARVAHLLGTLDEPRTADALVIALADPRFEVRLAAGRSLLKLRDRGVALERPERFFDAAKAELLRLSKTPPNKATADLDGEQADVFATLVQDRSHRTTEHVFRLLALVLEKEPIERAFKGVLAEDPLSRGTALEYLENVLPADVWAAIAPIIDQ